MSTPEKHRTCKPGEPQRAVQWKAAENKAFHRCHDLAPASVVWTSVAEARTPDSL